MSAVAVRTAGRSAVRPSAALAIAGPVAYTLALAALHVLRPADITRYGNTVSAYSVGRYGALSVFVFLALGAGALGLACELRRALGRSASARAGTALVGVFGVGFGVAGLFPFAPDEASIVPLIEGRMAPTPAGVVHGLAGFAALASLMAAMLVLARAFGRDPRLRPLRRPSLGLGAAAWILFGAGLVAPNPPRRAWADGGWIGAVEWRVFLACLVAWLALTALRLGRGPSAGQPRTTRM